jgi:hypothetical protein
MTQIISQLPLDKNGIYKQIDSKFYKSNDYHLKSLVKIFNKKIASISASEYEFCKEIR